MSDLGVNENNKEVIRKFKEFIEKHGSQEGLTEKGKKKVLHLLDQGVDAEGFSYPFLCILIEAASREGMREEAMEFAFQNKLFRRFNGAEKEAVE